MVTVWDYLYKYSLSSFMLPCLIHLPLSSPTIVMFFLHASFIFKVWPSYLSLFLGISTPSNSNYDASSLLVSHFLVILSRMLAYYSCNMFISDAILLCNSAHPVRHPRTVAHNAPLNYLIHKMFGLSDVWLTLYY